MSSVLLAILLKALYDAYGDCKEDQIPESVIIHRLQPHAYSKLHSSVSLESPLLALLYSDCHITCITWLPLYMQRWLLWGWLL